MCLTRNQKVVSSNPGLTTALCVLEQDTFTDLLQWSQPYIYKYQLLLGANLRWIIVLFRGVTDFHLLGANLRWIIVPSRGVIDFHPLNTTETGDKLRPYESLGSGKDLAISWHSTKHFESDHKFDLCLYFSGWYIPGLAFHWDLRICTTCLDQYLHPSAL